VEAMTAAVRAARSAGVPTGLVSNSWSIDHYDRDLLAELFDAVVISAEVRMHKPQPEIYLLAAEGVGRPPESCLFVDDLRENCEGAAAVGMVPVLHRKPEETITTLERLLGIPLI
jgi:putative hydrolase of the HAD superfamily